MLNVTFYCLVQLICLVEANVLKAFQSLCSVKAHYLGFHMSQKIYNQLSALNLRKIS